MSEPSADSRRSQIDAIKTPLAFIVLGLLIVETTVSTMAFKLSDYQGPLVWTVIISGPAYIAIVVFLAWFKPEALHGQRPLNVYAPHLATAIFQGVDGYVRNSTRAEQIEALTTLADVIGSAPKVDEGFSTLCENVGLQLRQLAGPGANRPREPGVL
jgi:hypothetical protein